MLILVAAVGSCDSDVPNERLHAVFTHPLLGAEAPLQTTRPGYRCPHRAPSPRAGIPAGSQPFSSTPACFPPSFLPRFWDAPGRCRCSHRSPCLRDAPPTSSPHRPLREASGALLRCFRACIGSWGTSRCKGHGGHVPATQDKGGLQTSLCPSEASAQDAAVVSWLVPAAALGARPGEGPAPGEQLWVPLPSITPKVKSRES